MATIDKKRTSGVTAALYVAHQVSTSTRVSVFSLMFHLPLKKLSYLCTLSCPKTAKLSTKHGRGNFKIKIVAFLLKKKQNSFEQLESLCSI